MCWPECSVPLCCSGNSDKETCIHSGQALVSMDPWYRWELQMSLEGGGCTWGQYVASPKGGRDTALECGKGSDEEGSPRTQASFFLFKCCFLPVTLYSLSWSSLGRHEPALTAVQRPAWSPALPPRSGVITRTFVSVRAPLWPPRFMLRSGAEGIKEIHDLCPRPGAQTCGKTL